VVLDPKAVGEDAGLLVNGGLEGFDAAGEIVPAHMAAPARAPIVSLVKSPAFLVQTHLSNL